MREKPRKEIVLPNEMQSNTQTLDPKRAIPNT
jgi:hypothetical protein